MRLFRREICGPGLSLRFLLICLALGQEGCLPAFKLGKPLAKFRGAPLQPPGNLVLLNPDLFEALFALGKLRAASTGR